MDDCFDLLLPTPLNLPILTKYQKGINWEGADYPQLPITYSAGPYIKLIEANMPLFLLHQLANYGVSSHWSCYQISGQTLTYFQQEIAGQAIAWGDYSFTEVLELIFNSSPTWVAVYSVHCDDCGTVKKLDGATVLSLIKDNLNIYSKTRYGFMGLCLP